MGLNEKGGSPRRHNWLWVIAGLLVAIVGFVLLVQRVMYRVEYYREMTTRFGQYGPPLLTRPLHRGGPSIGHGDLADFEMTHWGFRPKSADGRNGVWVTLQNKSGRTWKGVSMTLAYFDRGGRFIRYEPVAAGDFEPGQSRTTTHMLSDPAVSMYRIVGLDGR